MTKEKILKTFEDIKYVYNNCSMYDTLKHMLDELTEPCEDCISRVEVEKEFERWHKNRTTEYTFHRRVMELPSVQPIRPKGEWDFTKEGHFFCPYCKKFPKDQSYPTDFCPNCGADMRGTE